jgi:hypothetical protein
MKDPQEGSTAADLERCTTRTPRSGCKPQPPGGSAVPGEALLLRDPLGWKNAGVLCTGYGAGLPVTFVASLKSIPVKLW